MTNTTTPMQDVLPAGSEARMCFGCGADNLHGLRIKSFMEGDTAICRFTPESYHMGFPEILNGGIIATVLDCHSIWTSIGCFKLHHEPVAKEEPGVMFVTRKLTVEYIKPTPLGKELVVRGKVIKETERSATVAVELFAEDILCAKGEVVCVRVDYT